MRGTHYTAAGTHHLLYLEHDILQGPLEVGHFNYFGVAAICSWDLDLSCLAHGRRRVHKKHCNRILVERQYGKEHKDDAHLLLHVPLAWLFARWEEPRSK